MAKIYAARFTAPRGEAGAQRYEDVASREEPKSAASVRESRRVLFDRQS